MRQLVPQPLQKDKPQIIFWKGVQKKSNHIFWQEIEGQALLVSENVNQKHSNRNKTC